jgi:hypothetical protein
VSESEESLPPRPVDPDDAPTQDDPGAVAVAERIHPALEAYRTANRRAMRIYAGTLAAVVLVAFVAVRLAFAHGELTKVSDLVAAAPTPLPTGPIADTVTRVWRSDDHPAVGDPYSNGVVVTYAGHTVNGRDAATGQVRWHYTRSDETVCSVAQQDRSTIAIYKRGGNCDEVTGFDTATGRPKWYRTLNDNGAISVASSPNVVLVVAATTVHVIDNAGGLDRWQWAAPAGCAVDRSLAGSFGVLTSYHCGNRNHLTLHDLTASSEKWTIDASAPTVPVAASVLVAAADPATGTMTSYAAKDGKPVRQSQLGQPDQVAADLSRLPRAQSSDNDAQRQNRLEFIRAGGIVAVAADASVRWIAPATGPATSFGVGTVAIPDGSTVIRYRTDTGEAEQRIPLSDAPSGYRVWPAGRGLLVGADITEMYR